MFDYWFVFYSILYSRGGGEKTERKCEVAEMILTLERLIETLRGSKKDKTVLYRLHMNAKRPDFARHFKLKFDDSIHLN